MVITLAGAMFVCIGSERDVFGNDYINLLLHFLDLYVRQRLHTEVVILLELVVYKLMSAVNLSDNVFIHYLIARQLQKIKCPYGVVALCFRRFKPLLYLFSEFVVHNALAFGCHKITSSIIADKRREIRNFALEN